ncbi:MAG: hypothetical protein AAGD32_00645 [Planctomycetota bacterium]
MVSSSPIAQNPQADAPQSALRKLREQERRRLRGEFEVPADRAGERDVEFILPHLATSPTLARNFAVMVAERLDGGTLPYDNRLQLLAHAQKVGLRIFEANLIIAAVQHNAPTLKLVQPDPPSRRKADKGECSWISKWWKPIVVVLLLEVAAVVAWLSWR